MMSPNELPDLYKGIELEARYVDTVYVQQWL